LIVTFIVAAFASSFLLFWLELLFSKMALPLLGGSPAVWNSCLMYYQAVLLAGYLYAHVVARWLHVRSQIIAHCLLTLTSLVVLPIVMPHGWTPPTAGNVIPWLLLLLTVAIGAPFFLLSATAPLVQYWFSRAHGAGDRNPYVLYAASNAGSFCGLLAFPLLLEPRLTLREQSRLWSVGYLIALGVTIGCAIAAWRSADRRPRLSAGAENSNSSIDAGVTTRHRLRWLTLAFVPSSLLLGVTTYLSTDVASAPLLWIVPLAIYLLTFVIVFSRRGGASMSTAVRLLQAILVTALVIVLFWDPTLDLRWAYPLHIGFFAVTALLLHGELAASRPAPSRLTEYYLWLALGGALGGAFNALVAPVIFKSIAEYELIALVACFLRPWDAIRTKRIGLRLATGFLAFAPAAVLGFTVWRRLSGEQIGGVTGQWIGSVVAAAIAIALSFNPLRFGVSLVAIALVGLGNEARNDNVLFADRSFFGTYRVERWSRTNVLMHGTTIHGAQYFEPARRLEPIMYYHRAGPVGELFGALDDRLRAASVASVGLGSGALLCYGKAGQHWSIFEIDPLVERIARDTNYFTFVRDGAARPRIVLGDARLNLAREPASTYQLVILDAFSSDAIPLHLLTREAIASYERVLTPSGALFIHISNRHLDLQPVLATAAADAGLVAYIAEHDVEESRENAELDYSADWVVLAHRVEDIGSLASSSNWRRMTADARRRVWTDDYSNIVSVIKW
jgi:hypothetical protein